MLFTKIRISLLSLNIWRMVNNNINIAANK
jgi:hypothetical protein